MSTTDEKLTMALQKHRAGDVDAATQLYQSILADEKDNSEALHMLGVIAQQKGNNELALKLIEASLAKNPHLALAWYNRALVLRVGGHREEALVSCRQALSLDGKLAMALDLAGSLLLDKGLRHEALLSFTNALSLEPHNESFINNTAMALLSTSNYKAALSLAKKLEKSEKSLFLVTLGNIYKAAGYPERALPYFQKTRQSHPEHAELVLNEATTLLQIGSYSEGWALLEKRPDNQKKFHSLPEWRGQDINHLVLYDDQGLGDTLQFCRYIPFVEEKTSKISIATSPNLRRLLEKSFPILDFIETQEAPPKADARLRLSSLPALFKTRLDTIPTGIPYLKIDDDYKILWRQRLAPLKKPRIGLVWGGNPSNVRDGLRSIPFRELEPLLEFDAAHFISLQKGPQKDEAYLEALGILDADPWLVDFSDTAALLTKIDLLICVDTSVAHLAGALGIPVWMPLSFDPDFRWMLGREDSPWYPTLKLYRQTKPRFWGDVVERLKHDLGLFIKGDMNILRAQFTGEGPLKQDPNALTL